MLMSTALFALRLFFMPRFFFEGDGGWGPGGGMGARLEGTFYVEALHGFETAD
jgi:hypothetical protein